MTKYNAKPVIITTDGTMFEVEEIKKYGLKIEGIRFDSKSEGQYYLELLSMKRDGAISDFERQPQYELQAIPKITYIADFLVTFHNGQQVIVDIKGVETSAFRIKKNLFKTKYPNLELRLLTKKDGQWIETKEVKKEMAERKRAERQLLKRIEGQVKKNGAKGSKGQARTGNASGRNGYRG